MMHYYVQDKSYASYMPVLLQRPFIHPPLQDALITRHKLAHCAPLCRGLVLLIIHGM
jgi:hypothetical protein